jgi:PAB-dependent poly(A)-specific ribonuclease subunit 2
VAPSSPDPTPVDNWHVFNDFLVQKIPREEALNFDPSWKLPSVLTYQLKSARHRIDDSWKQTMDTSLLFNRKSYRQDDNDPVTTLTDKELPSPGTPVGIDAEFVSLQSEEIEIKANGTCETVRPRRLALARVSVLRGEGPEEDSPFIDDYIAIREPIVDYLTTYSGIRPGDLDPSMSQYQLVTLKEAYRKLWLLLNLGCTFVGHGLLKDFRTINIHVPRSQVIDTVDLWYIKSRARRLNLRFLAWLLLREDVQGGDAHDSIEDARTALHLWRKYEEVQSTEKIEDTLEWVYKRGREFGYRAPNGGGFATGRPGTGTGRNTPEPMEQGGVRTPATGTPIKRVGIDRSEFGSPLR